MITRALDATALSVADQTPAAARELRPHRLFLIIAPLLYFIYAVLTPPFQTPDEHQHLFRAWQLSEFHLIGERRGDEAGGVLPDSLARAALPEIGSVDPHAVRPMPKRPLSTAFGPRTDVGHGASPHFFNFLSVIYSPAGYIPQIAAIWIGARAGISVEQIVRLGRLFNAALAILLIYWAIRLTPVGSLILLWVGLLPMTAASSAALGQDGLIIGGGCLLTAIGLRIAFKQECRCSELLIVGILTILITLAKVFYLPLALIGAQPFTRGKIQWPRLVPLLIICVVAALVTALWLDSVSGLVITPTTQIPNPTQRLANWSQHPAAFPTVLEHTYIAHGPELFGFLFTFGWLNVLPDMRAMVLTAVACGLAVFAGDHGAARFDWRTRLWLLLIAVGTMLLISLALWLYCTPASSDRIEGLQGRYLIPLFPAILIALLPRPPARAPYRLLIPLLMLGANLFALESIFTAYYT